jgi:hypothetical protein
MLRVLAQEIVEELEALEQFREVAVDLSADPPP